MRYLVAFLIWLSLFSCNQNKPKPQLPTTNILSTATFNPVNDSTIFEFVTFLSNDTIETNFVLRGDKFLDQAQLKYEDLIIDSIVKSNLFLKEDLEFIRIQQKFNESFKLNPKYFDEKDIISKKSFDTYRANPENRWNFWEDYRKRYGVKGYCAIALPLFSKDKETVIIKTYYACGGKCGEGGIFIYKKIDGNWVKVKELSRWIA
nr:hypothetical protein [Pseudopedobacter sp.]